MGEICASDVVTGACDALVAGLDSPALRMLAACTRAEADYDVHDLLPPALRELGLTLYPAGSLAGQEARNCQELWAEPLTATPVPIRSG